MSAALVILPRVWATAAPQRVRRPMAVVRQQSAAGVQQEVRRPDVLVKQQRLTVVSREVRTAEVTGKQRRTVPDVAFYRKYTEAMLRRYLRLSMEAGRAPSLLGRELFRGKVTSCRVQAFDDVVIFVHDVERCLLTLNEEEQYLIKRIALQEYSQGETATMMGLSLRTLIRHYAASLDVLTAIFLKRSLLLPRMECQGVGSGR